MGNNHIQNMIPIVMFLLLISSSIELVTDEGELIDGFVYIEDSVITLDSWIESNNGYFGITENGDNFYLIITDDTIKVKIWTDEGKIRIIEPLI